MIGLVSINNELKFNDNIIIKAEGNNGLYSADTGLYFNNKNIIEENKIESVGLYEKDGNIYYEGNLLFFQNNNKYWSPPIQESSVYKPWNYNELISNYDKLMQEAEYGYIKKYRYENEKGEPILSSYGDFELYHYVLEPTNYDKTIFIQAGIHGNEMDAKQQLLRIVDILVNKVNQEGYEPFLKIRNNCRLIIIPCVSPYGHENASMNIPYYYNEEEQSGGINLNRNYDFNQQWALESVGVGGYPEFTTPENRHTKYVIEKYGVENINYAMDWHDGGNVEQHYWINYSVDAENRIIIDNFVQYLISKYQIKDPIIPNCKDTSTTGTAGSWFTKTMGLVGGTVEWIGGILGYNFDENQMTKSMEIRGNMILQAYENDIKGWRIKEDDNLNYFHFDYPKAFTKAGLRKDAADSRTIVTDSMIYQRWDNLLNKYPNIIKKSEILGTDVTGEQNIYTYTIGSGENKVLYVGGVMRYGGTHKIDEFAIYELIEYLCNDFIVSQSKFLQNLKNNYTIIVLPFIDNIAKNEGVYKDCGLNNTLFSKNKWELQENICKPSSYGLNSHDIPILKKIIDNNQDIKCIVSGGEIMEGYFYNPNDYSLDYETQIVIPKNQIQNDNLVNYKNHLINNRNENVVIENTQGVTFGDYAFDNYKIKTYFVQLKISKRYKELSNYHDLTEQEYLYSNYEAGRRIANIVNLFLL